MKTRLNLFFLFTGCLFLFACNNNYEVFNTNENEEVTSLEKSQVLEAPNGQRIAVDITVLKAEIRNRLETAYGVSQFEITQIDYMPVDKGYIAYIYYLTDKGHVSNIVKSNIGLKILGNFEVAEREVRSKVSGECDNPVYCYQCIQKLGKVCEIGCALKSSAQNPTHIQCTCVDECMMLVTK